MVFSAHSEGGTRWYGELGVVEVIFPAGWFFRLIVRRKYQVVSSKA